MHDLELMKEKKMQYFVEMMMIPFVLNNNITMIIIIIKIKIKITTYENKINQSFIITYLFIIIMINKFIIFYMYIFL